MGFWDNFSDDAKASSENGSNNRAEHRDALFLLAKIHFSKSGKIVDVRVRNLSAGGMMAESNIFCARGDRVVVKMANIEVVEGRVSWQTSGRFGIAFDNPVDPQVVRSKKSGETRPDHLRLYGKNNSSRHSGRVRRV